MLLGKGCMSEHANSPRHARQAIDILQDFVFVGDLAQWNLSICLFNRILTGRRFALPYQLANIPPGGHAVPDAQLAAKMRQRKQRKAAMIAGQLQRARTEGVVDKIDGAVYAYVQQRLQREFVSYGVRPECCPTYATLQDAAASRELCRE